MNEAEFAEMLVNRIRSDIGECKCQIGTKQNVFYAISVDEQGRFQAAVDDEGKPIVGTGTGFQQDILLFEAVEGGNTGIIPRVIVEVKLKGITTHDVITYSEKARRIRTVYPYVRYGMILGGMGSIPGRVLRLGQEFDFIVAVEESLPSMEVKKLGQLFTEELQVSKDMPAVLSGKQGVKTLRHRLELEWTQPSVAKGE
jgi:hypothetical protein